MIATSHNFSQQVIEQREIAAEARDSFTHNVALLRASHEEEKESWKEENETLMQEHTETK